MAGAAVTDCLLKDASITLSKSSQTKSFVWNYFGKCVITCEGKTFTYKENNIFCNACLQYAQKHSRNENEMLKNCSIKVFSAKTSTGNMMSHLKSDHNITDSTVVINSSRNIQSFFSVVPRNDSSESTRKRALVIDIVLLCCRDLLPFSIVDGIGFNDFCMKYGIVSEESEMPDPTTISRCLDFVYENCKKEVIKSIQSSSPEDVSMTFDQWTDKFRRLPYNTTTLHYWDDSFEAINLTLKTSLFAKRHTDENILSELENTMDEFGILNKSFHMISDAAKNARRACRLGKYKNFLCLGQGLNNLVHVDGIKNTEEVAVLITKCRNIVKALRYKTGDFHKISEDPQSRFDENDDESSDEESDEESGDDADDERHDILQPQKQKSLRLDVVTRWYSQLFMLDSLKSMGRQFINTALEKFGKDDLCLSRNEFQVVEEICKFLANFQKITHILSGETYSTVNMACVFRSEIASLLEEDPRDLHEIATLKKNMRLKFDYRFPMDELIVVGALLDPRFQNLLDIKKYLRSNQTTAFDLLKRWATETSKDKVVDVTHNDEMSFVDEMIEKHSTLDSIRRGFESNLDKEIYLLLSMGGNVKVTSIRLFWKEHAAELPLLGRLARKVLSIPMTSTPSERNFSHSGKVCNSRRSCILPSNVDKIIFIHNNYEFVKKIAFENFKI